jgi:hypothetical protein
VLWMTVSFTLFAFHLSFFVLLCAYIVWVISPPCILPFTFTSTVLKGVGWASFHSALGGNRAMAPLAWELCFQTSSATEPVTPGKLALYQRPLTGGGPIRYLRPHLSTLAQPIPTSS